MALGGGLFKKQDKVLPGAYINFMNAFRATSNLSSRGYAAMALDLDWGEEGKVLTIKGTDFDKKSREIFGYKHNDTRIKALTDFFKYLNVGYIYRMNGGEKATCTYGTAKYSGTRGNDLKIVVIANKADNTKFDVKTYLDTDLVDIQTVSALANLKDNDFVVFKKEGDIALTAGVNFTGGTNADSGVNTKEIHETFLKAVEPFSFNILGCVSTNDEVKNLYVDFTKEMRDEKGCKFQTVLYKADADYEGIINVENKTLDSGELESSLVYWLTSVMAGCSVNENNTNRVYDGSFEVEANYSQDDLEAGIKGGKLMFHKVGDDVRLLEDVNSLVSFTDDKYDDFANNQTIRVLDQIGNDVAVMFSKKYIGKVQNNAAGRMSFWNEVVTYLKELEQLQAIEDFKAEDVQVEPGNDKKSIAVTTKITPVNAMTKLYMTVVIK